MFAYSGVELIGVTAGEAQDPQRALPRATNGVILRILIFYLGALTVIMALVPWNELSPSVSPFVFVFAKLGVPGAASLITLVVITAASSSCNSGLFSTGRMLWSLAERGQAPRRFADAERPPGAGSGHPPLRRSHAADGGAQLPGAQRGVHLGDEHYPHRHAVDLGHHHGGACELPARGGGRQRGGGAVSHAGAPFANWAVVAFLVIVSALLWLDDDTRVALYVAPCWFGLLAVGYLWLKRRPPAAARAAS